MNEAVLVGIRSPAVLQEVDVQLVRFNPPGLADDMAKGGVLLVASFPVKDAIFAACWDTASDNLVDVDVLSTIGVLSVLDIEGNGSNADGLSLEPRDALQSENSVGAVVGEGFVLDNHRQFSRGQSGKRTDHNISAREVENVEFSRSGHSKDEWRWMCV